MSQNETALQQINSVELELQTARDHTADRVGIYLRAIFQLLVIYMRFRLSPYDPTTSSRRKEAASRQG